MPQTSNWRTPFCRVYHPPGLEPNGNGWTISHEWTCRIRTRNKTDTNLFPRVAFLVPTRNVAREQFYHSRRKPQRVEWCSGSTLEQGSVANQNIGAFRYALREYGTTVCAGIETRQTSTIPSTSVKIPERKERTGNEPHP